MPGFIHRLFGKDGSEGCDQLTGGPTLWDKGSPDSWYYHSKSFPKTSFKKWWSRSLLAHIGLELACYLVCYYIIHAIHKLALSDECDKEEDDSCISAKQEFEDVVHFFDKNVTPLGKDLTFLLGFYVSQIVRRWWGQFAALPSPDSLALLCHALVDFTQEQGINWAKQLMRFVMLAYVLCIRRISKAIKKQFPDNKSLISTGLATRKELVCLEAEGDLGRLWWLPLAWCMTMIKGSKEAKVVPAEQKMLIDAVSKFKAGLEKIDNHDHIILPPLYRQVVRFAVYVYFGLSLIAAQQLSQDPYTFLPFFLILKFIFFFGWLEVAEAIENPWGNDADDFQVCELLSRHVWAVGRSFSQWRGAPGGGQEEDEETEDEDEGEKRHVVSLSMELHKNN